MEGFEPISQERYTVDSWIKSNKGDNIVLYTDYGDNKVPEVFLMKRNYFTNVPYDTKYFYKCVYKNSQLIVNETAKEHFLNVGFFLGKGLLVGSSNYKTFIESKESQFQVKVNDTTDKFINKTRLEESYIGLSSKNFYEGHKVDVFFEEALHDALRKYSFQWDAPINKYLLEGESYFDSEKWKKYMHRYHYRGMIEPPPAPPVAVIKRDFYFFRHKDPINNIKLAIERLDRAFLDSNLVIQKEGTPKLWRGMSITYPGLDNEGDTIMVPTFTSTSLKKTVATKFTSRPRRCCMYNFILEAGIPYIDMRNATKYVSEKEILLPRNILLKHVGSVIGHDGKEVVNLKVSLPDKEQFQKYSACKKFSIGTIKKASDTFIKSAIKKTSVISKDKPAPAPLPLPPPKPILPIPPDKIVRDCKTRNPQPPCEDGKEIKEKVFKDGSVSRCCYAIKKTKKKNASNCTNRNPKPPCPKGKSLVHSDGTKRKCCYVIKKTLKKSKSNCTNRNPNPPCPEGKSLIHSDGTTKECCYAIKNYKKTK